MEQEEFELGIWMTFKMRSIPLILKLKLLG